MSCAWGSMRPDRPVASLRDSYTKEISLVFPGIPKRHTLEINSFLRCGLQQTIAYTAHQALCIEHPRQNL